MQPVKLNQQYIRRRVRELGETIFSLSKRSELGEATWYRLVNQQSWNWTAETLAVLAHELQCSPLDLIEREDNTC